MPQRLHSTSPNDTESSPPWKVGELAQRTGLTVRTIHHYHAIGLLTPSDRTPGRHRLYSSDDVAQLQHIHALRALGLPLADIRSILAGASSTRAPRPSPLALVNAHRAQLRARIDAEGVALSKLDAIAQHLETAPEPSVGVLCVFLQQLSVLERVERHFTPQQLADLALLRSALGSEQSQGIIQGWQALIPAVANAIAGGVRPESADGQELATAWLALLSSSTGNAAGLAHAAQQMYEHDGDALSGIMPHRPTAAMFEFIELATSARVAGGKTVMMTSRGRGRSS